MYLEYRCVDWILSQLVSGLICLEGTDGLGYSGRERGIAESTGETV